MTADDETAFWALLADAHRAAAARSELNARLAARLSSAGVVLAHLERQLAGGDAAGFHRVLPRVHRRAYRRDVWTAFDLALGGVDAPAFAEAISWLILAGRPAYDAVLAEPDALAELAIDERDLLDAAGLDALDAFPPVSAGEAEVDEFLARETTEAVAQLGYPDDPPGAPLPPDLAVLRQRYPRLTDRHVPRALTRLPRPLPSLAPPR